MQSRSITAHTCKGEKSQAGNKLCGGEDDEQRTTKMKQIHSEADSQIANRFAARKMKDVKTELCRGLGGGASGTGSRWCMHWNRKLKAADSGRR